MATTKKASRAGRPAAAKHGTREGPRPGEDYWDWRERVDGPGEADPLVENFLGELRAKAHAQAIFNRQVTDDSAGFKILSRKELNDIARYEPLVEDALVDRDLNMYFGPSGSLKSFFLQDLGLTIAAGLPDWHGHKVHRHGDVVYVAAEGASGILQRVEAWEKEHDCGPVDGFRVLPMAVNLFATRPNQTDVLLRSLQASDIDPVLLIFDTQARCTVGANESSPGDMNVVVDNLQRIITATGSAVAIAHHADKEGKAERGTESIRNASGLVMRAKYNGSVASLKAEKLKEQALDEAVPIQLRAVKLVLAEATPDQREVSSLVLRSPEGGALRGKVHGAFQDSGVEVMSATALAKAVGGRRATALQAFKDMCQPPNALLVEVSGGYSLAAGFKKWRVDDA